MSLATAIVYLCAGSAIGCDEYIAKPKVRTMRVNCTSHRTSAYSDAQETEYTHNEMTFRGRFTSFLDRSMVCGAIFLRMVCLDLHARLFPYDVTPALPYYASC